MNYLKLFRQTLLKRKEKNFQEYSIFLFFKWIKKTIETKDKNDQSIKIICFWWYYYLWNIILNIKAPMNILMLKNEHAFEWIDSTTKWKLAGWWDR